MSSFTADTIGHLLHIERGGWLVGLGAARDESVLTIEEVALDPRSGGVHPRWRLALAVTAVRGGDAPRGVTFEETILGDAEIFDLPLHPRARDRVVELLADLASRPSFDADAIVAPLLDALVAPVPPGSFAAWYIAEVAPSLCVTPGVLARVESEGQRVDLFAGGITVGERCRTVGSVTATLRAEVRAVDGGALIATREDTVAIDSLPHSARRITAPRADDPELRALVATWRVRLTRRIERRLRRDGALDGVSLRLLLPQVSLAGALLMHATRGPAGARPEPVRVTEGSIARGVEALVPCPVPPLARRRSRRGARVKGREALAAWAAEQLARFDTSSAAAFSVGAFTLVLAPATYGYDGSDSILLAAESGPLVPVLVGVRSVDGDAPTFRGFATWLREVLVQSDHDPLGAYDSFGDDGERGAEEDAPLSEWLRFREANRVGEPLLDWRIEGDLIDDGDAYWSAKSGRASTPIDLINVGIATYHRFIQTWIDPACGPRPRVSPPLQDPARTRS